MTQTPTMTRIFLLVLWAFVLFAPQAFAKGEPEGGKIDDFEITIDQRAIERLKLVLDVKIGELYARELSGEGRKGCEHLAVKQAQYALFKQAIEAKFLQLFRETARGVKDGAKLAGAKTIAKLANYAGQIAEAFEMEEPAAALGQALIKDALDWGVDKAKGKIKTGNDDIDEAAKDKAKDLGEKAKEKLIDALFPGKMRRAVTWSIATGTEGCDRASVTVEFQEPKPGAKGGGLFVSVDGHCHCQYQKASPVKLGRWKVTAFFPIVGWTTSMGVKGWPFDTIADLRDLYKSSKSFKDAIDDKLGRYEGKDEAPDIKDAWDDLKEKTDKASSLKPILYMGPVFGDMQADVYAECNCPQSGITDGGGGGVTEGGTAVCPPGTFSGVSDGPQVCPKAGPFGCACDCKKEQRARDDAKIAADAARQTLDSRRTALGIARDDLAKSQRDLAGLQAQMAAKIKNKVYGNRAGLQREIDTAGQRVTSNEASVARAESEVARAEAAAAEAQRKEAAAQTVLDACKAKCQK